MFDLGAINSKILVLLVMYYTQPAGVKVLCEKILHGTFVFCNLSFSIHLYSQFLFTQCHFNVDSVEGENVIQYVKLTV